MTRLVLKDNITAGGELAPCQTLRLGSFTIKNPLRIDPKHSKQMDPAEFSSLNELLDSIAALGIATDYDQIWLKPDQREIKSPPVTHQISVVEERDDDSSPI